ncbi:hypothetical protein CY34DRAFT_17199 [Suillus luteus UH-Slu-Lm8-n1]|uniref:Uncharacterized protein n=1 Tax=Suillus luteus UH-Slu-Lm8-n1 TaxID=930992 RepID=A0A0D0AAM4_9AGAM|nr:hypothetical protein CY34DRAFT_17199 [Suillus luteus UH-Slu-Lm8-n1]
MLTFTLEYRQNIWDLATPGPKFRADSGRLKCSKLHSVILLLSSFPPFLLSSFPPFLLSSFPPSIPPTADAYLCARCPTHHTQMALCIDAPIQMEHVLVARAHRPSHLLPSCPPPHLSCLPAHSPLLPMSSLQQEDITFLASLAVRQSPIGLTYDCAVCGGALPLTICWSDKSRNSGKPMARYGSCAFFRWFPQLLLHPDIMALIPGGSPTLGVAPSFPFPSTQPLPSSSQLQPNNKKSHKQDIPRPQDCDWGLDQENFTDLETCWANLSLDAGVEMNDGLRALQYALQFAGAGGQPIFPSLHDILTAPVEPPTPSQQPPQASLPSLSQQPPHLLTLSQNDDASAMPAFLIHTPSKPPHVTDQLDPLWAGDLNTCTRKEIESTRVAGCRKEMERKAKQHFVLYWFDADNVPVLMQWVMHCPYFPHYQLSDDPTLVASLGANILKIDVFEECFMRWIPSVLMYPFTLDSRCHVFI